MHSGSTEPATILTGIEEFLTGSHASPSQSHRAFAACCSPTLSPRHDVSPPRAIDRWRAVMVRFGDIDAKLVSSGSGGAGA